jgi:hypothetical protein
MVLGFARDQGAEQPSQDVFVHETVMAKCSEETGSMLVRRPILLSPDGKYQTYAEIESRVTGISSCLNTSKLFVKRHGDENYLLVYREDPSEYECLNDIRITDWSPDSRYLLFDLIIGQWGSGWGDIIPLLYDTQEGTFTPEQWLAEAFSRYFGHKCYYLVWSKAFTPSGSVVLRIRPETELEGDLDPESCVKKEQLLLINPATHAITPFEGEDDFQRYGRILDEQPGK